MRICVFCGSRSGSRPQYVTAARDLGRALARRDIGLVYGGGRVGLMGELADAALAAGGVVIGVVPRFLVDREAAHRELTELRVVDTLSERKALMAELSGAFAALPGGMGTLDETIEMWTWTQLGRHAKPCCLIDIDGYFRDLVAQLDRATADGFLPPHHRASVLIARDAGHAIELLTNPPITPGG